MIQDIQFSTLGLTLIAELSRIRSSLAAHPTQADDEINPTTKLADTRDNIALALSEDVGETVGRNAMSILADIEISPIPTFDPLMGPGCVTNAEKHLNGRKRAGLDATKSANADIKVPKPKAGAAITGLRPDARSASIQWQRQRESVNTIDDIFHGLS